MGHSPIVKKEQTFTGEFTFGEAMTFVLNGKKVTRREWGNPSEYVFLFNGVLSIHHAKEAEDRIHTLMVSDGDLKGEDWLVIEEIHNVKEAGKPVARQ